MDDIVLRGMAKWPDVPAVYGWLALNRRGQWLIKGDPISNPAVSAFIGRNYERDSTGHWFFQNGPQRVFVSLEYTPFVYRVAGADDSAFSLETHTGGRTASIAGMWVDEHGVLLAQGDRGVGVIHDHDLDALARAFVDERGELVDESALDASMERLQQGRAAPLWFKYGATVVKVAPLQSRDVPRRFDFVAVPAAPEGHPDCT